VEYPAHLLLDFHLQLSQFAFLDVGRDVVIGVEALVGLPQALANLFRYRRTGISRIRRQVLVGKHAGHRKTSAEGEIGSIVSATLTGLHCAAQRRTQQLVEMPDALLALGIQTSGKVRTRRKAALDGFADRNVLALHEIAELLVFAMLGCIGLRIE